MFVRMGCRTAMCRQYVLWACRDGRMLATSMMMSLGVGLWVRVHPWLLAVGVRYWQAARLGLYQIPSRNPDLWYESSAYWQAGQLKTQGWCGPMKWYLKGLIDAG
jgi:hypothetical protein